MSCTCQSRMDEQQEVDLHFDISRIEKNMFSNPFSFKEHGIMRASICYKAQLNRLYKKHPCKFKELEGKLLVCNDTDCTPQICHKYLLRKFLKNKLK